MRGPSEKRDPGEDQIPHPARVPGSKTHRNPTTEGVSNQYGRLIEFCEYSGKNVGVAAGADDLIGHRTCPETGQIRSQCGESFEARFEIDTTSTPPVKSEYAGWPFTEDLGEEGPACK